ncbi:MAG: hypothetical protein JWR85_4063 [Marmoricola sp.]|nr:hypothetical protein [Marmoricola sp.]
MDLVYEAREALVYALEEMESMIVYVPDYFAEKWGYDESIERVRAAIAKLPAP